MIQELPKRAAQEGMKLGIRLSRAVRIARHVGWALLHRQHPVLVHLIPVRRCNLACAYCNEYDATSAPVPRALMLRRVDRLSRLGTSALTLSGGEPLLHPELEAIVERARSHGMVVSLNTNGYLLSPQRIDRLNRAGLDHLQISIDNVEPDAASLKSLRLLEPKLRWLSELATFSVAINSVLGSGVERPEDALVAARRARELGFMTSVGLIHDGHGQLRPLGERETRVYRELKRLQPRWAPTRLNNAIQDALAQGRTREWRCRAGARYLYVDEFGLVHYCSQQRGMPAIPLERYTRDDLRREYGKRKPCAEFCTINCVQQTARFDNWRSPQRETAELAAPEQAASSPAMRAAAAAQ